MRRARLSEYKFLHVLRAFSDDLTVVEAAAETRISQKTIRALYRRLRAKLIDGVHQEPEQFGRAGFFLCPEGHLSPFAEAVFDRVGRSIVFEERRQKHCPKTKDPEILGDHYFETAIRHLTRSHLPRAEDQIFSKEVLENMARIKEVEAWMEANKHDTQFLEENKEALKTFAKATAHFKKLQEKQALDALVTQATPHQAANNLLYDDLRRYLLKHPL